MPPPAKILHKKKYKIFLQNSFLLKITVFYASSVSNVLSLYWSAMQYIISKIWPFNLPHFAEIPIITHPESGKATYRESEAVSISCKTSGKPVPYVSWIHNGRVKNSGSKTATLNFSSISKADAGSYTCKANNSAGITEKQLILLVNCKYHMTHPFV